MKIMTGFRQVALSAMGQEIELGCENVRSCMEELMVSLKDFTEWKDEISALHVLPTNVISSLTVIGSKILRAKSELQEKFHVLEDACKSTEPKRLVREMKNLKRELSTAETAGIEAQHRALVAEAKAEALDNRLALKWLKLRYGLEAREKRWQNARKVKKLHRKLSMCHKKLQNSLLARELIHSRTLNRFKEHTAKHELRHRSLPATARSLQLPPTSQLPPDRIYSPTAFPQLEATAHSLKGVPPLLLDRVGGRHLAHPSGSLTERAGAAGGGGEAEAGALTERSVAMVHPDLLEANPELQVLHKEVLEEARKQRAIGAYTAKQASKKGARAKQLMGSLGVSDGGSLMLKSNNEPPPASRSRGREREESWAGQREGGDGSQTARGGAASSSVAAKGISLGSLEESLAQLAGGGEGPGAGPLDGSPEVSIKLAAVKEMYTRAELLEVRLEHSKQLQQLQNAYELRLRTVNEFWKAHISQRKMQAVAAPAQQLAVLHHQQRSADDLRKKKVQGKIGDHEFEYPQPPEYHHDMTHFTFAPKQPDGRPLGEMRAVPKPTGRKLVDNTKAKNFAAAHAVPRNPARPRPVPAPPADPATMSVHGRVQPLNEPPQSSP